MKTLKIAALAVALSATSAIAQTPAAPAPSPKPALATDEGWNADWALLFSLNNILTSGSILGTSGTGSISGSYFLSDETAVRAGFSLSRQHNPVAITKVVSTTGTDSVTTYTRSIPGFTEFHGLSARGDYLKRLGTNSVAPYLGGGLSANWSWARLNFLDEVTVVDQRTAFDNNTSSFGVALHGILGAEWRVHSHFAFYAEYNLSVTAFQTQRVSDRITVESTVGGGPAATSQTTTQRTVTSFLNVSTGLAQGATLGLQVFF